MVPPLETCYEGGDQSVQQLPPVSQAEGVIPTCVIETNSTDCVCLAVRSDIGWSPMRYTLNVHVRALLSLSAKHDLNLHLHPVW